MTDRPLVSAICGSFERPDMLAELIENLRQQTRSAIVSPAIHSRFQSGNNSCATLARCSMPRRTVTKHSTLQNDILGPSSPQHAPNPSACSSLQQAVGSAHQAQRSKCVGMRRLLSAALRDVLPGLAADGLVHDRPTDAGLFRELPRGRQSCHTPQSSIYDDGFSQFGGRATATTRDAIGVGFRPVPLTASQTMPIFRRPVRPLPPLRCHVSHVIGVCACEEMTRANAAQAPAVAMVEYPRFLRQKWPIGQQIGDNAGELGPPVQMELAPPIGKPCARPQPARSEFGSMRRNRPVLVDLLPEAISYGSPGSKRRCLPGAETRAIFALAPVRKERRGAEGARSAQRATLVAHQAHSLVSDPGQLPLRRGHFVSRFYTMWVR
jgi:hypothetical protein